MRKLTALLIVVVGLVFASPTLALAGKTEDVLNGLNGMITAPADPVVGLLEGDSRWHCPVPVLGTVTDHLVGLFTGTLTGIVRGTAGLVDIPMAFLPWGPYSPEAMFWAMPTYQPISEDGPPPGFPSRR